MSRRALLPLGSLLLVAGTALPARAEEPQTKRVSAEGLSDIRLVSNDASWTIDTKATSDVEIEIDEGDKIPLKVARDDDRLSVKCLGHRKMRVHLPPLMKLDILTVNGTATINGSFRRVLARSMTGGFRLDLEAERIEVRTLNGPIDIRGKIDELALETVSGDIDVDGGHGEVKVKTVSGAVRLKRFEAKELTLRSVSGDLHYAGRVGPDSDFCIHTMSGDAQFLLEGDPRFEVNGRTHQGTIQIASELKPIAAKEDEERSSGRRRRHHRVSYVVGKGGGQIRFESFAGSLRIAR